MHHMKNIEKQLEIVTGKPNVHSKGSPCQPIGARWCRSYKSVKLIIVTSSIHLPQTIEFNKLSASTQPTRWSISGSPGKKVLCWFSLVSIDFACFGKKTKDYILNQFLPIQSVMTMTYYDHVYIYHTLTIHIQTTYPVIYYIYDHLSTSDIPPVAAPKGRYDPTSGGAALPDVTF